MDASATVTLLARHEDPQVRDELVELLLSVLENAVNGVSLGGLTLPPFTMVERWAWAPPTPPERRIAATVGYRYLTDGWQALDTTE